MFGLTRSKPEAALTEHGKQLAAAVDAHLAERTAPASPPASGGLRRFEAAVINRLTQSWQATNVAIDQELRTDLDRLRARSREQFKNNEFLAKFGRLVKNNLVGPEGFRLQARAADNDVLDTMANKALEKAFWQWSRPDQCDVTGRRSFADICRSVGLSLARDGEYLIRKRRGQGAGYFGYQLQVLDVDRLDTTYNVAAANGRNAVIMGVEVDQWRKPVAYHLWNRHPNDGTGSERTRERVPASDIFHGFIPLEDEQTRGVPWAHAVLRRLNDLNGYREAAVIASRIGAAKMGFFTAEDGNPARIADAQTDDGEFVTEATPGTFGVLPAGYDFKSFDPDYPHAQFDAFSKATLRGICSGLPGASYHVLGNDLEGVSFSSIRSGELSDRDEWMVLQNWLITQLLVLVYEDWLDMALLRGAILLPNGSALPLAKRSKFIAHLWQGRRWQWVDPLKDMTANILAIENGLASPQQIAAQTGRDIEEVINDLAAFREMLAAKNVTLTGTTAPTGAAVAGASAGDANASAKSGE